MKLKYDKSLIAKYALKIVKSEVLTNIDKDHFLYNDPSQTGSTGQVKLLKVTYSFFLNTYLLKDDNVKFNAQLLNDSAYYISNFGVNLTNTTRLYGKKFLRTNKFLLSDTYYLPVNKSTTKLLNNKVTHDLAIEMIVNYIKNLDEI